MPFESELQNIYYVTVCGLLVLSIILNLIILKRGKRYFVLLMSLVFLLLSQFFTADLLFHVSTVDDAMKSEENTLKLYKVIGSSSLSFLFFIWFLFINVLERNYNNNNTRGTRKFHA
jgi:uncharacterized membrane protein